MSTHVVDFTTTDSTAWSSEKTAEGDVKVEEVEFYPAAETDWTKPTRVSKAEAVRSTIRNNPRKTAGIVFLIVAIPLFLGLLSRALNHNTHKSTLITSSTDTHNNVSTLVSSHAAAGHSAVVSSAKVAVATATATSTATAAVTVELSTKRSSCFPLGSATLPTSGAPDGVSRDDWWCEANLMYGFMGFSYPLESSNCDDSTNSFSAISADFKAMKARGASMVRIYAPECRQVSVWENLVQAAVANNMGIIVQVWWGFLDDQDLWETGQANIYSLFTSSDYAAVAPYVVHSASFGSEPIGDGVDGGPSDFVVDLAKFRKKMNNWGIPVGISEDWDRRETAMAMNATSGTGLGWVGTLVKSNTDVVHAHVMPYYHPTTAPEISDAMPYTEVYLRWLRTYVGQPIFITETMWSSENDGGHSRGADDDQIGLPEFKTYWNWYSSNCALFKELRVGWFMHTWSDTFEPGFGLIDTTGDAKISGYHPRTC
ncbi:hypothetical protein RQP46_000773 [Phenoliferia psychrophenolica]